MCVGVVVLLVVELFAVVVLFEMFVFVDVGCCCSVCVWFRCFFVLDLFVRSLFGVLMLMLCC